MILSMPPGFRPMESFAAGFSAHRQRQDVLPPVEPAAGGPPLFSVSERISAGGTNPSAGLPSLGACYSAFEGISLGLVAALGPTARAPPSLSL